MHIIKEPFLACFDKEAPNYDPEIIVNRILVYKLNSFQLLKFEY
jgi:hypothetical protein